MEYAADEIKKKNAKTKRYLSNTSHKKEYL